LIPLPAFPVGEEVETALGRTFRIEQRWSLEHFHGPTRLGDLLTMQLGVAAELAARPDLSSASPEGLVFLDTETTGLAGGAGTLVFLVGVGSVVQGEFRMRQYFLRHPDEEPAMLLALAEDLERAAAFVTFNGRSFDVPLLEMRYVMGLQRRWRLHDWPQLDLLFPSRRLWRRELIDCSLGSLERHVLRLERTQQDVPGADIPGLYLDYLRTGRTDDMARVIYHNAQDVLAMVALLDRLLHLHQDLGGEELTPSEALAIARWHSRAGRWEPADAAYRRASAAPEQAVRIEALRRWAEQLKRSGNSLQAVAVWREWHDLSADDPRPCVELAKYYEWEARDPAQARHWAASGMVCLSHWPADWRRGEVSAQLEHRLERLARKVG
jgi:hypothetical protein